MHAGTGVVLTDRDDELFGPRARVGVEICDAPDLGAVDFEHPVFTYQVVVVKANAVHLTLGCALKGKLDNGIRRDRERCFRLPPGVVVHSQRGATIEDREVAVGVLVVECRQRQGREVETVCALRHFADGPRKAGRVAAADAIVRRDHDR